MTPIKKAIAATRVFRHIESLKTKYLHVQGEVSWLRHHVCLVILILVVFFSFLELLRVTDPFPLHGWTELRTTLEGLGMTGPFVFVLAVAFLPLISPISILIITGSAAFGPIEGILLSYAGALLNANITFFLVKTLGVEEMWGTTERTARIKSGIRRKGFHLVLLLQTVSVVPFVAINSAAAAAGIDWKDFMKATMLGAVPGIVLYSLIGEAVVSRLISPEVYVAFVAAVLLLIVGAALRKRYIHFREKRVR